MWAGANPRRRVGEIGDDPAEDADGLTALEQAVSADKPEYLQKLGLDPASDDIEALYAYVHSLETLRALVAIRSPLDWHRVTMRFLDSLCFSLRLSIHMTSFWEVEQVFALGGRIGTPDSHEKRELRRLLLLLDERSAQRLFALLRQPERMDHAAFLDLIAHEKLATRWTGWSRHQGVDKALWAELAATRGLPASVRRTVRAQLYPPRKVIGEARFEEAGETRVLSREQLYDLVWSEPLLTLAKRFGLSDNGLRKRCKAMNVPTPPRGYWQQPLQRRRRMRPPLPPLG